MVSPMPSASFSLIYRGTDISGDLDPQTTVVSYTDHLHGVADELELRVQDRDGLWKGSWRPEHGDEMQLIIRDGQGGILPAGTFEMDEPEASGSRSGDFMTIRGLAAPITKALRSEFTRAYERQTTRGIVEAVAGQLDLTVEGEIAELFHTRVTQRRERYLSFLKRLAEETGHYCSLRGTRIIFTTFATIDGAAPTNQLFHGDRMLIDYAYRFQSTGTYSKGKATYLDERQGKNIEVEATDEEVTTGDELRISGERLESAAHAQARLNSDMHYANRNRFSGSVTTVGTLGLVAGTTCRLVGFGGYSGTRVVNTSTHRLVRGGYTTTAELVDART